MSMETVLGQPSWKIEADLATAFVTQCGGMIAPLEFKLGEATRQVFHVAPWAEESQDVPPVLQALRGDFFCMPFGLSMVPWNGQLHPLHGEIANEAWTLVKQASGRLELEIETKIRPSRVRKTIEVRAGETVLYSRNVVSDCDGPLTYGHHAMPRFPDRPGAGILSFSPFCEGLVFPGNFEEPSLGGYSALRSGALFDDLARVPCKDGSFADLSRYPARPGFEDLAILMSDAGTTFAWSAVTFPDEGYVWFCLKDPRVLPGTILWMSNGGRHYAPWNGRHRAVLGIEEVCTGLPSGVGEAIGPNILAERGHKTRTALAKGETLAVNVIVGAVPIPEGFGSVLGIAPTEDGIEIEGWCADLVSTKLDVGFLYGQN